MPHEDARETPETVVELDVRGMHKPDKHPAIFALYAALPIDGAFVLINDHDPRHLRDEFEADHSNSYSWEYLSREKRDWRIKISKLASSPLPQVLVHTTDQHVPPTTGAEWKLQIRERDLDSNLIALPPGGTIDAHAGPDLDVLVHVVFGSGTLTTELDTIDLMSGQLLWLPRRSRRAFTAGDQGLRYLTVHQRRKALVIDASRARK